ncbi:hypothetical protein BGZ58_009722 [Dissophora ornata]|nr:hypothetical protein BGZ58_009722 [Dissophora ornata]
MAQGLSPTQSSTPIAIRVPSPVSDSMVNQNLRSRMKRLEINPRSPSSGGGGGGDRTAPSTSRTSRRRARMDRLWKKGTTLTIPSSLPKNGQSPRNSSSDGSGTSSNMGMSAAVGSRGSRVGEGVDGSGAGAGRGRRKASERGKARRNKIDRQFGTNSAPTDETNGGRREQGRRGRSGKRTTVCQTEGPQSQTEQDQCQYQYQHQHQPRQLPHQQQQPHQNQDHQEAGAQSSMFKSSLLQGIQSHVLQPTQLTHLTLLRYEFLMDEFLEMMHLLPSLQALNLEIISLLSLVSSTHPCCPGQCGEEDSEDSDRMLVDQDDQAQWDDESHSDSFLGEGGPRTCGLCTQNLRSRHQFPAVRSLTFRGTVVVPELLAFFPSLEALALEETRYQALFPPSYSATRSHALYNSTSKTSSIESGSPCTSGYNSSSFYTDSDSDSLNAAASVSLAETASSPSRLSLMIADLAHTILDGCPRLNRLVLNEPLLVDDYQIQELQRSGQPQQLTLLLRAIPQLTQFVTNTRVVAKCPGLVETLVDYHHPHLCSFQILDEIQNKGLSYAQQPPQQYQQQQQYQEQLLQHQHLNWHRHSLLLQQTLHLQQQHQEQQLDTLMRLRHACLRILECCPKLQIFEAKIPVPLQDLIASVPRWACSPVLTVLRLEVQELTVNGGLDAEEEEVMQMFVKSLFLKGTSSASESSSTTASAELRSQSSESPSLTSSSSLSPPYPSTEPSSGSGSPITAGSGFGSSSFNSQQDSLSLSSSSSEVPSRYLPHTVSAGASDTESSPSDTSSSRIMSSTSESPSMSASPSGQSTFEERASMEDAFEAVNDASSSDQSSHRLRPPHFSHGYNYHGHGGPRHSLPSPPPPPIVSPSQKTTSSLFLNAYPAYYQIEAVGRLVALQYLVEHQLVYLPKLDRLFLGNSIYKIPTRN